jgi:hypothetical protein
VHHLGEVLGYEDYIAGNVHGGLRWRAQRLQNIRVVILGDTAVLTALVADKCAGMAATRPSACA